jgi:signal transduction histidine kinase
MSSPSIDTAGAPLTSRAVSAIQIDASRAAVHATVGRWVVHDLRGPILGMGLIGDMLADGDRSVDPSVGRLLRENSRRARELIDVLALLVEPVSRDMRPVALGPVLDVVVTIHRSHRGPIGLTLDRAAISQLPAVRASNDGLLHLVLILLLNALDAQRHQETGSIRVTGRLSHPGSSVELIIDDAGPGLPANVRQALESSGEWPSTHRGLGLPVARSLARRWGGTLTAGAQSEQGGARLVLALPLWKTE